MTDFELAPIERVLSDFAWYADRGDGTSLAELFVPDGVLCVGGQELKGRLQIADDCRRRASQPDRKTRHIWSNLRIERAQANSATGTAVQLTFEQHGPDTPTQLRVNDLFDEFEKDAQGVWRLARRVISREMSLSL